MPRPPSDPPLPSPPPVARNSDTRPPPPLVLLALCLPPAVEVAAVAVAKVATGAMVVSVAMAVVEAEAVAVRLPPAAARARTTLPALILQPLDWHHQHVVRPVHGCSSVLSSTALAWLHRCTTPRPSAIAGGGLIHTSLGTSPAASSSASVVVVLDFVVDGVGPVVPC
jgi:hypothetical protein